MNERDFVRLKIMRDEADQILLVASHAPSATERDNKLLDDAISFSVRRLGVMAERVSPQARDVVSNIPWSLLIETAHNVIEHFDSFDAKDAWAVATNVVPSVRAELERLIENTPCEAIEMNTALPVEWRSVRERIGLSDEIIAEFCERHSIRKLSLFGSVLRDDFRPDSDIDVLVEFEPDKRLTFFDLGDAEQELSDLLGRKVDFLERDLLNEYIRDKVLTSARVVYVCEQCSHSSSSQCNEKRNKDN